MSDKRLSRTAMREMGLMDDQQPREPDREPVTAAPDCGRAECYIALPHAHHVRSEAGQRTRGRLEVWDAGFAAGREAAAGTEGRTLDVERLARAINECCTLHGPSGSPNDSLTQCAPDIAAEYHRLAAAAPTPRIPEDGA